MSRAIRGIVFDYGNTLSRTPSLSGTLAGVLDDDRLKAFLITVARSADL